MESTSEFSEFIIRPGYGLCSFVPESAVGEEYYPKIAASIDALAIRPLTDEQRRARAEKARRDYQEQEVRRAQARRDIALMETYTSEDQIEAARQAALAGRQVIIDRSRQRLESLAAERTKLDNESEFYASRKLPAKLEHAIEANKELAQAEHRLIADMQVDMQRLNRRFDAELARFRELVLAGAKPLMRTGDSALH